LSLTENGYLFMLRAQEILDLAKQAKNELSENGDILHGVIRVGIVESKIMDYFADAVVQFNKKYPHVQFEVYSADGDDLKRNLDENKLDMALLIEPVESAKYTKIPIEVTEKWGLVIREEEVSPKKENAELRRNYRENADSSQTLHHSFRNQQLVQSTGEQI